MLGKLLTPFTTAAAYGVATRYITVILTTAIAVLGLLNVISTEQADALKNQVPELVAAVSGLVTVLVAAYGTVTKSSSDKALEVAKKVDEKIAPEAPVIIKTPGSQPDIKVSGR